MTTNKLADNAPNPSLDLDIIIATNTTKIKRARKAITEIKHKNHDIGMPQPRENNRNENKGGHVLDQHRRDAAPAGTSNQKKKITRRRRTTKRIALRTCQNIFFAL